MRLNQICRISGLLLVLFSANLFSGNLDEIKQRKKLIMLSSPHPYSAFVRETSEGQYEGLDVYIMKTLANSLGVALEIQPVPKFEDLIPELLAGKGDVIASSFSITPERGKIVRYSEPYFPVVVMVVVRKDSAISAPEDLAGKKGSVVEGSSQEERMKKIKGVTLQHAESSTEHYKVVQEGRADFAFLDSSSVLSNIDRFPELKVAFHFPEVENYGFAVRPDSDLIDAINQHLKSIQETGSLYTMIRRTMGDKGVEMLKLIK
jgi:ABC-type amino acid transport substrate-binding protein